MKREDCKRAFFLAASPDRTAEETQWLEAHLASCVQCREDFRRMASIAKLVERDPVPPSSPEEIQTYLSLLTESAAQPQPAAATAWWKAAMAAAVLVALLGAVSWYWFAGHSPGPGESDAKSRNRPMALVEGHGAQTESNWAAGCPSLPTTIQSHWKVAYCGPKGACPRPGARAAQLPAGPWHIGTDDAPVRLTSASEKLLVIAGPHTKFSRSDGPGWDLRLDEGSLYVAVDHGSGLGRCLRIETTRGTVRIQGTRFLVKVQNQRLELLTYEGTVRFVTRAGRSLLVEQGRQLAVARDGQSPMLRLSSFGKDLQPPEWVGRRTKTNGNAGPDINKVSAPATDCNLGHLRALGRRSPQKALNRTKRCLRTGRLGAEGRMLQAELILSMHQAAKAARIYHQIAKSHRGSNIGQDALFTAGQIELTRLGSRARALRTFHTYLKWYPSGRYARDVQRVLHSLQRAPAR